MICSGILETKMRELKKFRFQSIPTYSVSDYYFFVSADRHILDFEMTANLRDTSPLRTISGV